MDNKKYLDVIDQNASLFTDVSDKIWEYAELSLMEFQSAELYCKVLKDAGFEVETPVAGIKTAFKAIYGSGKPVIGILAEYDALSGLSQIGGATERKELVPNGCGHGCGHNMLGAGAMAAAFAVKKYLEDGHSGTVIFYGCPGEEGGAAKAFMARDRIWKELDAALTWHPSSVNQVTSGTCNTCIQVEYKFTGVASHASGAPELGRSALDAVELMNVGVQFLREHMPDSARIHYAITDAGGNSPTYTKEEEEYAKAIISSYEMTNDDLPGDACDESEEIAAWVDKVSQHATIPLNNFLIPYHFSTHQRMGSTDVGDVSWLVPTAQINVVTFPSKAPGHSWQNVSCGKTSIGHKGLLTAGKVLAATAIELFENPRYLEQAKEEFEKRAAGGYYCPVPDDAVPTVVGGKMD